MCVPCVLCGCDLILTWRIVASFSTLFEVRGDLSAAVNDLTQKTNASGRVYYGLEFEAIVYFGLTEIKAELAWQTKVGVKSTATSRSLLIFVPEWRTPVSLQEFTPMHHPTSTQDSSEH